MTDPENPEWRVPGGQPSYGAPRGQSKPGVAAWGIVAAAAKAGGNHYNATGDRKQALQAGAGAFVRWWVWVLAFTWWWLTVLFNSMSAGADTFYGGNGASDIFKQVVTFLIAPWFLGVTWCRCIDYSLFRRGIIYRFFAPVAALVERVPTILFYLLGLLPLMV